MENKKKNLKPRKKRHKVYYGYYHYMSGSFHPVIRIGGKYLKEFGFNIGDAIEVSVSKDTIYILRVDRNTP